MAKIEETDKIFIAKDFQELNLNLQGFFFSLLDIFVVTKLLIYMYSINCLTRPMKDTTISIEGELNKITIEWKKVLDLGVSHSFILWDILFQSARRNTGYDSI